LVPMTAADMNAEQERRAATKSERNMGNIAEK